MPVKSFQGERAQIKRVTPSKLIVSDMFFSIDDTLNIPRPIQVPLFEIVMKKYYSHQGICSRLLL